MLEYGFSLSTNKLATMVDENEAVAHRQPVLGRRLLDNMEIRG
jgi:hypothetical protein